MKRSCRRSRPISKIVGTGVWKKSSPNFRRRKKSLGPLLATINNLQGREYLEKRNFQGRFGGDRKQRADEKNLFSFNIPPFRLDVRSVSSRFLRRRCYLDLSKRDCPKYINFVRNKIRRILFSRVGIRVASGLNAVEFLLERSEVFDSIEVENTLSNVADVLIASLSLELS